MLALIQLVIPFIHPVSQPYYLLLQARLQVVMISQCVANIKLYSSYVPVGPFSVFSLTLSFSLLGTVVCRLRSSVN